MPQVIEWTNVGSEDIVWRYPTEDITWGAQLIVHEYEMAVFFRDGKAYDVFGPGRHTLTTLNLPLITSLLTRLAGFGGNKPFKATVLFISTKVFAGKWGTKAQTTELAPLQTYGQFWFKVGDASLFVNEVVGGQNAYTTEGVNSFLRGFLNEKIIDELSHYDLVSVFTKLDETSVIVKNTLIDYFKRVGIELTDLRFEGIDTTPEYRERLFWLNEEIIQQHGSGERLEIHGSQQLADYIKANTDLQVDYNSAKGEITIPLKKKIDALAALAAAEQSGMDWGDIQTRQDSLDDVFIKLVSEPLGEQGETEQQKTGKKRRS
jgi:hypothetical protein